jgi:hypothetical protein
MGHEDVADTQEFARGQIADVTDIEEQRAILKFEIDVNAGIAENIVDEISLKTRSHSFSTHQRNLRFELQTREPQKGAKSAKGGMHVSDSKWVSGRIPAGLIAA